VIFFCLIIFSIIAGLTLPLLLPCHCGLDPQSLDFQVPCFRAIAGQARNDKKNKAKMAINSI